MAEEGVILPVSTPVGDSPSNLGKVEAGLKGVGDAAETLVPKLDKATQGVAAQTEILDANTKATEANTKARKDSIPFTEAEIAAMVEQERAMGGLVSETGELIDVTTKLTETEIRATEVAKANAEANQILADSQEKLKIASIEASSAIGAGQANFGKFYTNMTKMEAMGTPAVLKAATWGAFAVGGIAYEGIKTYAKFNADIVQSITQAGRPLSSMNFLTNTAISTAKSTGVALNDVASIIYRVSSATAGMNGGFGASNKQIADMTKNIATLSVIGGIQGGAPTEQSARVMGALMNTNLAGLGTDPSRIAAFINAMTGAGDVKQSDVISSLGRGILSSAAAKGISASSIGTYIDLLTSQGTPGSTAGTYAKTALSLLTAPGAQAAKALAMVGINTGDLNVMMQKNNGVSAVAQYLHDAMQKFDPSQFNVKYKGLTGAAGATALLENWGVGNIPQSVVKAWSKGILQNMSAADLGTTQSGAIDPATGKRTAVTGAQWLNTLENLIITKAFGGSRSAASVLALANDPSKVAGIQANIDKNMTPEALARAKALALSTPQAQFNMMKQTVMSDLLIVGKTLTPIALTLGKAFTGLLGAVTKFKPVIIALGLILTKVILQASASKLASLGKGIFGLTGAAALKRRDKLEERLANLRDGSGLKGRTIQRSLDQMEKRYGKSMRVAEVRQNEQLAKEGKASQIYSRSTTAVTGFTGAVERATGVIENSVMGGGVGGSGSVGGRGPTGSSNSRLDKLRAKALKEEEKRLNSENKFMSEAIASSDKQRQKIQDELKYAEQQRVAGMKQYNGPLTKLSLEGVGIAPLSPAEKFMMQEYRTGQMDLHGSDRLHTSAIQKWLHANEYESTPEAANRSLANIQQHLDMYKYAENATPAPKVSLAESLKYRLGIPEKGIVEDVEKTGLKDLGKDVLSKASGLVGKLGGGLLTGGLSDLMGGGIGGLLSGGLGMAGGPIGMMLMSTLGPMMMPLMGKALSGIGHFFGGIFGGGSNAVANYKPPTTTYTGLQSSQNLQSAILADKATLGNLSTKIANGTATKADYAQFSQLTDQMTLYTNQQKNVYGITGNGSTAVVTAAEKNSARALAKKVAIESNLLSGNKIVSMVNTLDVPGELRKLKASGIVGQEAADIKKIFLSGNSASDQVAMIKKLVAAQKNADVQSQINDPTRTMSVDPNFFKRVAVNSLVASQQKQNIKTGVAQALLGMHYNKNLTQGQAVQREGVFLKASLQAQESIKADQLLLQNKNLDASSKNALTKEIVKLGEQQKKYQEAAKNIAGTYHLSQQTISGLSKAIASGVKDSNVEIGLTSPGMAAAFQAALGGGGLKGVMQKIDADIKSKA